MLLLLEVSRALPLKTCLMRLGLKTRLLILKTCLMRLILKTRLLGLKTRLIRLIDSWTRLLVTRLRAQLTLHMTRLLSVMSALPSRIRKIIVRECISRGIH
jgi:hypothetical protein